MDLMSLIGWVLGFGLMFVGMILEKNELGQYAIKLVNINSFVDLTSIVIVIGGVIAALMISFPMKVFGQLPKHFKIILFPTKYDPHKCIEELVNFAQEARVNGLLALEDKLNNTKDEFMRSSLMLVVDSVDPEKVKMLLENELDYLDERHSQGRLFYEKGASFAPAMGMLGTLIGLINLLKNMSDPDALGASMAVALVTTFYGSLLANLVFSPIATKLKARHDEEYLCKMIICEGVQSIQAGENPRFIEEKLTQFLARASKKKGKKGKASEAEQ